MKDHNKICWILALHFTTTVSKVVPQYSICSSSLLAEHSILSPSVLAEQVQMQLHHGSVFWWFEHLPIEASRLEIVVNSNFCNFSLDTL